MDEIRFERVGVFTYSREEGTPAAQLPNQIPDKQKQRRREKIMKKQAQISAEWAEQQLGTTRRCLVEGRVTGKDWYIARSHSEAADIDGIVRIHSTRELAVGEFVTARVTEADTYDLTAELVD
jgi:ribosomal protein S12 methylthiotransferase